MSYTTKVKAEVIKVENTRDIVAYAEMAAVFRMSGHFYESENKLSFEVTTENPAFARRLFSIIKDYYNVSSSIEIINSKRFKQHNDYIIRIENTDILDDIIQNMEIEYANSSIHLFNVPGYVTDEPEKMKAYIRGAFLAGGSVSNPEKTYHLELKAREKVLAKEIEAILHHFDLKPKVILRNSYFIIYLKESDNIRDFLGMIGASDLLMEFENIRIMKEMRNSVNRLVNCETSNLDKTVTAGVRQTEDILLIEKTIGLSSLPDKLEEIARLRLEEESLSFTELGELTTEHIGKSGVSHRLRKITQIADDIREKNIEKSNSKKSRRI